MTEGIQEETLKVPEESKVPEENKIELTLCKSMLAIMREIKVAKSQIGTVGKLSYTAFIIESVLKQTKVMLPKYGIVTFVSNELQSLEHVTKASNHNVIVKTTVTFMHVITGESYNSTALGEASGVGDKGLSKAQTDGFKKVLCQTFHLCDGDGDKDNTPDGATTQPKITPTKTITPPSTPPATPQVQSNKKITPEELSELQELIVEAGKDVKEICTLYNVKSLSELEYSKYSPLKERCRQVIQSTKAKI